MFLDDPSWNPVFLSPVFLAGGCYDEPVIDHGTPSDMRETKKFVFSCSNLWIVLPQNSFDWEQEPKNHGQVMGET